MTKRSYGPALAFMLFIPAILTAQISDDSSASDFGNLLQAEVSGQEGIVESASRYAQRTAEAPSSISIITRSDIEHYGYRTLAQLLNSQTGFYTTYDRNYSYAGVRGFSRHTDLNNRVLLLIDGHRMNDHFYDQALLGSEFGLDLSHFERVEIVRGPGSALYGTSALFAVINLIPRENIDRPSVYAYYGSFGSKNAGFDISHKWTDELKMTVMANYGASNGEDLYFKEFDSAATSGKVRNRDGEHYFGTLAKFTYKKALLTTGMTSRFKEVPTASFESVFGKKEETTDAHQFADLKWDLPLMYNMQLNTRAYTHAYQFRGVYPLLDTMTQTNVIDVDKNRVYSAGSEVQVVWDPTPNDRIIAGIDANRIWRSDYRIAYDGVTDYFGNFPYSTVSIYALNEWQIFRSLMISGGIRRDDYIGRSKSYNPRAAAVLTPWQDHVFKLLYGQAFRTPNNYEVNYDQPEAGYKRSSGLRPEKIYSWEGIWNYAVNERLQSTLSLFHFKIRDIIDQVEDTTDNLTQYQNTEAYTAAGMEWALEGKWSADKQGYFRYSLQNARNLSADKHLTNSPFHIVKAGLVWAVIRPLTLSPQMVFESSRKTLSGNTVKSFYLIDLNVVYDVNDHIKGSLKVGNLMDRAVSHPGGPEHVEDRIPQAGRTFEAGLNYQF